MSHSLAQAVAQVFAPDGALARDRSSYSVRTGQLKMAQAVADTIEQGSALVVEAGTGVGKTFAYLIPALLSGRRTVVSTATKNLQDQLFNDDLPYLTGLLGIPVRLALLKGRSSYLCIYRLDQARQSLTRDDGAALHAVAQVERFSHSTTTGDLSELAGLDERSPAIPLVTSTRENCLGSNCPAYKECWVNLARKEAAQSDVIVVNHHLFFADMAVRENTAGELLPWAHTVVFDEAHQLNDIGTQFLGVQVGVNNLHDLARDVMSAGLQLARGLAEWPTVLSQLEQAVRVWRLVGGVRKFSERLKWTDSVPEGINPDEWPAALRKVEEALQAVVQALDTVSEIAPDFPRLHRRSQDLLAQIATFYQPCPDGFVRWLELGQHSMRMVQSPLDIADTVRKRMLRLEQEESAEVPLSQAWIFTSATLGDATGLQWFTEPCGLETVPTLQVESPFDYQRHACIYVPPNLPEPVAAHSMEHAQAVAHLAGESAQRLQGRTLVLTTTLRNLKIIGDSLKHRFEHGELEVLVQGEGTKRALIERFRRGSDNGRDRGCVLVASVSFWEGVDVPGDSLQLVIIDKLPFQPPDDPLVQARTQRLERQGKKAFTAYTLPEAAVMLKQGAGRLIRSETDRGILVIADVRLRTKYYGKRLLAALPPMYPLQQPEDYWHALGQLQATHPVG